MGACSLSTVGASTKVNELSVGKAVGGKGATIKSILVTLPASYDAGGSTLDLSPQFPNRVFWALPMTASAKNASTGYIQIGLVPGTAKTDAQGGFASTDWKLQCTAGATQSSGDLSAYVTHIVACGY